MNYYQESGSYVQKSNAIRNKLEKEKIAYRKALQEIEVHAKSIGDVVTLKIIEEMKKC